MRTSMITLLAAAGIASAQTGYTTSTVRATSIITVTSCAATVTDCPAAPHVTTVIVDLYTTICPVTATETGTPIYPTSVVSAASVASTAKSSVASIVKSSASSASVSVAKSTSAVVSVKSASATASGVKSASSAVIPTTSAAGVTSVASITTVPVGTGTSITKASSTSSSVPFNAAGANTAGGLLMAAGLVAALL